MNYNILNKNSIYSLFCMIFYKSHCFYNRNQKKSKTRKEEIALERRCRTAKSQYLNRVITYEGSSAGESDTDPDCKEAGLSESYLNAVLKNVSSVRQWITTST